MKIGEILKLTQEKRLSDIAKEHLNIGEKPTREALKNAGCYSLSGKKGWYFDGDEGILEKEIYEFTKTKPTAKVRTKVNKNEGSKKEMNITVEEQKNGRKRASFDLDAELLKQLKVKAVLEDKNIYELVEQAIAEFLAKK